MNAEDDTFVKGLAASLDKLAHLAPLGPDATNMHMFLRRRRNRRLGRTAMAIVGVLILGSLIFMQHQEAQLPPQQVAQTIGPLPPMAPNRSEPSPLVMPTVGFVIMSQPGPGPQTRFDADMPSMIMPVTMVSNTSNVCMGMVISDISMPSF